MKKDSVLVTTNFTGKKFMCVGLTENPESIEEWTAGFSIGNIYYECRLDTDNRNLIKKEMPMNIVLLMDDNKNTIYADADNFVEVEGMHKVINSMWIGLN